MVVAATDEELVFWNGQEQLTKTNYFEVLRYLKISILYNQGNAYDTSPVHVGFVIDEVTFGYIHSRRKNVAFWDACKTKFP